MHNPKARIFACLLFGIIATGSAQAERVAPVEGVFYYQPAALGFGSETVWNNPAGLGLYRVSGFQAMADYADNKFADSWGGILQRDHAGIAYRKIDRDGAVWKEWIFGFGAPITVGQTHFGASYRYFKAGPGYYNKRHLWNIGLLYQSSPFISWGAVFSNLNRGRIDGERSEIEQRYSIAYRPRSRRLTFAVDMLLGTKTRLSNSDFVYYVEGVPSPGLILTGLVDSDKNFELGFRVNLLRYFVGSRSGFDRHGDSRQTTAFWGATNMRQASLIPERGRRLAVSLSGRPSENPPRPMFGRRRTAFADLLAGIYRAADDPSIREMLLNLRGVRLGMGQAQEMREALRTFRSRGKQVVCHLSSPNNIGYYLASICDRILIPPVSQLNLVGLRAELTFYTGAMEKLGVNADIIRTGAYKTAPETYMRRAASDENREQVNYLLDQLYLQFTTDIAEGRGITPDSVARLVDMGPFTSAEALKYGLVDGLSYRDEVTRVHLTSMPEVGFRRYRSDTIQNSEWGRRPVIAVVVADGDISFNEFGVTPSTHEDAATPILMERAFRSALAAPEVKGIVLRINSPGGYALAGEDIYRTVQRAAEKKPVTVSMANMAASGGYYIAMAADHLFANPATVTGSVGIYGGKVDLAGLYEKLDIGKELYTRGRFAAMLSLSRPFTDEERQKYTDHLESFYAHFLQLVADNRSLSVDSIDVLSQGRVWTGRDARANGLVDELGGLREAVAYTAERLGLKDYRIALYPQKRPLFVMPRLPLLGWLGSMFGGGQPDARVAADAYGLPDEGEVLARLPYDLVIE